MTYTPYSEHEILGDCIIFKKIVHDECACNPLEDMDCMGSIYSFCNRHVNFAGPSKLEALIEEYGKDVVFLSYFEHGLCKWGVAGSMSGMPDFQWDGVDYAGLWVPDKHLLEDAKELNEKERGERMELWAKQACELYTQWCNGEVYGVIVEAYKLRKSDSGLVYDRIEDYRYETPVAEESCFGYFGMDCAEEELENNFLPYIRGEVTEKKEA